jgi:hypothetical protein
VTTSTTARPSEARGELGFPAAQGDRHRRQRDRRRGLQQPDTPEARVEHSLDHVRIERLDHAEPARGRALEDDAGRGSRREPEACDCQRRRQTASKRASAVPEDEHERRRPARRREQQPEVDEANGGRERTHASRAALEHLGGDSGRLRARLADVEDERAGDRMRVSRDHPPRDGVRAVGQLAVQVYRKRRRVGPRHAPRVHPPRRGIEDADAAERGLHRFVEAQHDARRRACDDGVVRGLGCQQHRVSGCLGRDRQRCEQHQDEPEAPPAAPGRSDFHVSSSSAGRRATGQRVSEGGGAARAR